MRSVITFLRALSLFKMIPLLVVLFGGGALFTLDPFNFWESKAEAIQRANAANQMNIKCNDEVFKLQNRITSLQNRWNNAERRVKARIKEEERIQNEFTEKVEAINNLDGDWLDQPYSLPVKP